MKKQLAAPIACISPFPNLLVSCRGKDGRNNALVVGYAANVSGNPPMVAVGIVPDHYSWELVKESGEFAVNIPTAGFEQEFYYLGSKSGRDEDKFEALNLKWEDGTKVNAPLLSDCPISMECKVVDCIRTGDHDLFIGSVEAVHCDEAWLDENGNLDFTKIKILADGR